MSAIAQTIDERLRRLPPTRAAHLERLIIGLLDLAESNPTPLADEVDDLRKREQAMAALDRIAARGRIKGISDPVEWQREQRADRLLSGRES